MINIDLYRELVVRFGEDKILSNVPMKDHTSMRVGGAVDILVQPDSIDMVRDCISYFSATGIQFLVMGNGSNLIFADEGYSGVVIKIGNKLSKIEVNNEFIIAQAGATLTSVSSRALAQSLTGLEFASGIPGSVGGAAFMNAGAYDGEMKQVVFETLNIDKNGEFVKLNNDEHKFSYRNSSIQDKELTCIQVIFRLEYSDHSAIASKMSDLNARRRDKQPLNMPSAGSAFKRPLGQFAGKLIEKCGLRGFSIGGAQVSEKHCGFIVNTGFATANDVISLIAYIQKVVYEKTGVILEPEVRIIGGE